MYTSVTGEEYVLEPGERGEKQQHSPWSAPRDRRKRNKHNPSPLTISEDFEYTSPPKRHNGTIVGPNSHGDVAQGGILKDGVAPACQAAHAPVLFPPPDGQSPAARALRMSQGLDDHIPALHTAGPLAQVCLMRGSLVPRKYSQGQVCLGALRQPPRAAPLLRASSGCSLEGQPHHKVPTLLHMLRSRGHPPPSHIPSAGAVPSQLTRPP